MNAELRLHPDRASLHAAALAVLQHAIAEAQANGREALVGLSGGSTPMPVYRALAQWALPWSQVQFLVVDERFVAPEHPHSNEGQLRQALAVVGPALRLTGLRGQADDIVQAAATASQLLASLPQPDLLLLGMGEDGHIASLFPVGRGCAEARDPGRPPAVVPTWPEPLPAGAPHPRLSLNRAAIASARACLLLISGPTKRRVWEQAQADPRQPVADLLATGMPPLQVHWSP